MNVKFGFEALQVAIFTRSLDLTDKLEVAQALRKLKTINFEGEPTIFPLPEDAPLEIPRIILKSKDNSFALNISPIRTDLIFQSQKSAESDLPNGELSTIEKQIIPTILEVFEILSKNFSANVSRAAVIAKIIAKLDMSSKEFLQKTYIQKMTTTPYEIKTHFLFKEKLGDFQINKWKRLETLRNKKNLEDDSALLFALDINTLLEIDYKFTPKNLEDFYKKAMGLIENEMKEFQKLN